MSACYYSPAVYPYSPSMGTEWHRYGNAWLLCQRDRIEIEEQKTIMLSSSSRRLLNESIERLTLGIPDIKPLRTLLNTLQLHECPF